LNLQLFQGKPVLSYRSGVLSVNTDYIFVQTTFTVQNVVSNVMHTSSPTPVMATVSGSTFTSENEKNVYANVVASPVAVETRSMYVVIPTNAGPGSVLTVVAPNGSTLSVSLIFYIYYKIFTIVTF